MINDVSGYLLLNTVTQYNLTEEAADINSRTGAVWNCQRRIPSSNGFSYEFTYNASGVNPFPASEPTRYTVIIPNSLGFALEGSTLTLPSIDLIRANWETLRKKRPYLPELKIYSSAGILSDEDFIQKWTENHLIVSTNKEFVHDLVTHVHPTLVLLSQYPRHFAECKADVVAKVKWRMEELKSIESDQTKGEADQLKPHTRALMAMTASIIDAFSTEGFTMIRGVQERIFGQARLNNTNWSEYFNTKYRLADHGDQSVDFYYKLYEEFTKKQMEVEARELNTQILDAFQTLLNGTGIAVSKDFLSKVLNKCGNHNKSQIKSWLKILIQLDEYKENRLAFVTKIISILTSVAEGVLQIEFQEFHDNTPETDLHKFYLDLQKSELFRSNPKDAQIVRFKSVVFSEVISEFIACSFHYPAYSFAEKLTISLACTLLIKEEFNLDLIFTKNPFLIESRGCGADPTAIVNGLGEALHTINRNVDEFITTKIASSGDQEIAFRSQELYSITFASTEFIRGYLPKKRK